MVLPIRTTCDPRNQQFSLQIKLVNDLLVFFLLNKVEKLLIELAKHFLDGSLSGVLLAFLSHFDDLVDNRHYERCILVFVEYELFFRLGAVQLLLESQKIADFDVACIDEIVLLIVSAVHLVNDFSHALGAASWRGHGVAIGQINHDAAENGVQLDR
jgi:hypothetical protein